MIGLCLAPPSLTPIPNLHFRLYFEGLGTLAPSFLASERPIATACFLEVTFLPLPVLSFPSFISCMVSSTFSPAFFEYFAMILEY